MDTLTSPQIEDRIARCRLMLSGIALAAVFADPTEPFVSGWLPIASGRFTIDPYVFGVLLTHLAYSIAVYAAVKGLWLSSRVVATLTTYADVVLGALIALMTEGATSPFYPFFAFAVVVAGFRSGLRRAMQVTAASVLLYLAMILISAPGSVNVYIMRPAYLAIVGYLVGYLGQMRIEMQEEIQRLEAAEQRHRIARDLHDGFAQALAGISLRIETCRRLLGRDDAAHAQVELTGLQSSVNREYDDLRTYMATLAGVYPSPIGLASSPATRISLSANIDGSIELIDHVLQIAREGVSNVRRHSAASSARIQVSAEGDDVRISIEDDGVGLRGESAPWSIVSRVKELGGRIAMDRERDAGSRLQIVLPQY